MIRWGSETVMGRDARARQWQALLLITSLAAACGGEGEASSTAQAQTLAGGAAPPRVVNVEVLVVRAEPFEDRISITGTVEAERNVTIAAEETGVIRELFVARGGAVRAGDPIARIDANVLRAQLEQAEAEAALARETYERQRTLWEDERIGSEISYLRARYGAETAAAQARVLAARLARTVVRAPIAGVLDARFIEVGSMVTPGVPVGRIVDIDTLKVTGGVPERYAGEIRPGSTARVQFDNFPDREFAGRIVFVGASVNEQNRTFPVEVAIANAGGMLKPGMVAQVRLARGRLDAALLVPREAVLRTDAGYQVYVVVEQEGQSVVETRPVTTGAAADNRIVVSSGLAVGDRVVVVGQQQATAGDVVRVVNRQDGV